MTSPASQKQRPKARVYTGDCLTVMATFPPVSVSAIVTDPPYGINFLDRQWDHGVPGVEFWREALRVAKPGAHLAAFGGSRTWHRLATAIEDAGWEIRDCLMWLYGTGFPHGNDIAKTIDKQNGHWRGKGGEIVGQSVALSGPHYERTDKGEPITEQGKTWSGWNTSLKPSVEPIVLARKPFDGSVADNVVRWGTGAINIDATRLESRGVDQQQGAYEGSPVANTPGRSKVGIGDTQGNGFGFYPASLGRWPANVIIDEEAATILDAEADTDTEQPSRFFYTAKVPTSERWGTVMCSCPPSKAKTAHTQALKSVAGLTCETCHRPLKLTQHVTVKPVELMRWLVRLVTPPNGLVLDPFCGSGSTGVAAREEGFRFVGIELDPAHAAIASKRVGYVGTEAVDR